MSGAAPLDTRYPVETPEGVALSLRTAGPVPRALAWLTDLAVRGRCCMARAWCWASLAASAPG